MNAAELDALKARVAAAEAAREVVSKFTKAFNTIANCKAVTFHLHRDGVSIDGQTFGDGCYVTFDTDELRNIVVNYLVDKQQAALKEFQAI